LIKETHELKINWNLKSLDLFDSLASVLFVVPTQGRIAEQTSPKRMARCFRPSGSPPVQSSTITFSHFPIPLLLLLDVLFW
jgi:hypothetical protein